MAANPVPAAKAGAKGTGNVLTKKIGPLPGWAWAGIVFGGYYLWKKHQASAAAATPATTATPAASLPTSDVTAPSGYGYQGPGAGGGSPFGPGWNIGTPTGTTGGTPFGPGANVPAGASGVNTPDPGAQLAAAKAYLAQTQPTYGAAVNDLGGLNNPSNPTNQAQAQAIWNAQTAANNTLLANSPTYNPNTGI
jgi:hypothetical protein